MPENTAHLECAISADRHMQKKERARKHGKTQGGNEFMKTQIGKGMYCVLKAIGANERF